MTERQLMLYRFLLKQDKPLTLKEIAAETPYYDEYLHDRKFSWEHFHDTTCRRKITLDITELNHTKGLNPIVSGRSGVQIANAEITARMLNKEIINARKKIARLSRQYRDLANFKQITIEEVEKIYNGSEKS